MTPEEAKYKHEHKIESEIFGAFNDLNRDIKEGLIQSPDRVKIRINRSTHTYNLDTDDRQILINRLISEWTKYGWYCYYYDSYRAFEIRSTPKSEKSWWAKLFDNDEC